MLSIVNNNQNTLINGNFNMSLYFFYLKIGSIVDNVILKIFRKLNNFFGFAKANSDSKYDIKYGTYIMGFVFI